MSAYPLPPEVVVFGRSEVMRNLRATLEKGAHANVPILLQGESGTGKDVLARFVHLMSPWGSGPFVKINCPAVPAGLMESELFGYEKGAFTGAYSSKPGRMELANRGTLFLDEISELDFSLQSKLLEVLQDGQCCRIGGQENTNIEARVICATNRRLEDEVNGGRFRQDLFYRINVIHVRVPALRERSADIPILVNYFHQAFLDRYNCRTKAVADHLLNSMMNYAWPGNIRELENVMKRYVILGTEEAIYADLAPSSPSPQGFIAPEIGPSGSVSLKEITRAAVRDVERQVILKILQANNWNRRRAARALNISYRALLYKMKEVAIASPHNGNGGNSHPGL
ncbi:MAG: sigma-54 interaction domain-containing protein [Terriglobales bacterium]